MCQQPIIVFYPVEPYQTDTGMCGDYDSVIGMNKEAATDRFTGSGNSRLSVALGAVTICGLWSKLMMQEKHQLCVRCVAAAGGPGLRMLEENPPP